MKKNLLFCFSLFSLFSYAQIQIGTDIKGESAFDLSGESVSLSSDGNVIAIGAYLNDGNGGRSGQTRIYEYNSGIWVQIGSDIDGEAKDDQSGRSVSLSGDGKIVAIGAIGNNGYGLNSSNVYVCDGGYDLDFGHVRIYEIINNNWIQVGSDIDGEAADDRSGISVSLSNDGTIVAIGATSNDGNGRDSGHVRIYKNINDKWIQIGADIDGESAGDLLGYSVSLSNDGTIVAIGGVNNDGNGIDSGHVRIYKNINDTWTQIGSDIDGESAGDRSGYSVSLSNDGSIVAIGAINNGVDSGHVRIYKNINDTWTQIGSDINGESAGVGLGYSVSLSNDGSIVAIGAVNNDSNSLDSGHVRIYKNTNGNWTQIGLDIDGEGESVSLSSDGSIVAIGSVNNDSNGVNSGHVRIYTSLNNDNIILSNICEGGSTTLTAPTNGTSYLWSTGETSASINVSPTSETNYNVVVSDEESSNDYDFRVSVNTLIADAGLDVTIDEGSSTTLTASGGDTYLWSTGETTPSINVSPAFSKTYMVTAFSNGCSSNDDVSVTVNLKCAYDVINSEGFETGWGIWNDGGSDSLRANSIYSNTGSYSMRLRDNTSTSVGTTDNLNLTDYKEITIDFSYYCRSMDNSNEDFWLQVSTNGGENFTTVEEWNTNDEFVNNEYYNDQVIIPGPFTANTQFRFRADASGDEDFVYIDDIVISGCSIPSCVINSEGFETGWGIWNDGGLDSYRANSTYSNTGSYSMRLRDNTSTSVGTTDNLDLTTYEEITIDFSYYCRSMDNSNEDFWLQVSTNGGENFTTVEEWNTNDEFVNNEYHNDQVIIPGPFTANTQFRFRADASGDEDFVYIDDIVISGCSSSSSSSSKLTKSTNAFAINEAENEIISKKTTSVIYPNPFVSQINIKIGEGYEKAEVEVLNVLGQLQYSKIFYNKKTIEIPTLNFPNGQYLIRIKINNEIIIKRAIKK